MFADVNAAFVLYPALLSLGAWIFVGLAEAVGWAMWEKHQGCLLHRDVCVQAAVLRMGTGSDWKGGDASAPKGSGHGSLRESSGLRTG